MTEVWTKEQQQVISLRDRNLLVSAAAGSGKTAVLVERILRRLTDESHPVDIDRLLVVTFTRAAAAEMRERIGTALREKLEKEPENEHLQRQETLLLGAQITTIDSFCRSVIGTYFHTIGLDPGFTVIDENEANLLQKDAAEELLEECYAQGTPEFHAFVEWFAVGKKDDGLADLIRQVYRFAQSEPWPEKWIQACRDRYEVESVQELEESDWVRELCGQIHRMLDDFRSLEQKALAIAREPDGPWMYEKALLSDLKLLDSLREAQGYCALSQAFAAAEKMEPLSRKRGEDVSGQKRDQVKELRRQVKDGIGKIREQFFCAKPEEMLADIQKTRPVIHTLLDLVLAFDRKFTEKKQEKNQVDFADLEHLALRILVRGEDGEEPTEAANELADRYEEILIDEYQDSNRVQELLLTSVSRCSRGQNNLFMVGDVKQSIYRFRLACPEIFMGKYRTYTREDSDCQKIELHQNFRSRAEVLADVNHIFRRIMHRDLGNVEYDDDAALYPGAHFPGLTAQAAAAHTPERQSPLAGAELLLLDLDQPQEPDGMREWVKTEDAREQEARMIGGKIRELVGREQVYDRRSGQYRPVRYQDIVILLRSTAGWAEKFLYVLTDMGIPAYTGAKSGYFSAVEVQTVLALLEILDNPRQEIPFTAVLTSPLYGFDAEELARIRTAFPDRPFYEACRQYKDAGEEEVGVLPPFAQWKPDTALQEKLSRFFDQLERFRAYVPCSPMNELITRILDETGYLDLVTVMPAGGQRRANLEMLIEKAAEYERSSYRGLFSFVRYIENLKNDGMDFGEAGTIGEGEDTVRIMSIHKSKGLEFPVVFVAALAKNFNRRDSRSLLAVHSRYGVACDRVDAKLRTKTPNLLKKTIQQQLALESMGEELRVLYVAFTRAKEKLYLTAALKHPQDKFEKWGGEANEERLTFTTLSGASSALEWVLRALLYDREGKRTAFPLRVCTTDTLVQGEKTQNRTGRSQRQWVFDALRSREGSIRETEKWLDQETGKRYPNEAGLSVPGKISVSDLERRSRTEEAQEELYEKQDTPILPAFRRTQEPGGAERGTAMHHVMRALAFSARDAGEIRAQIADLVQNGRMTQQEADLVDVSAIDVFLHSDLGRRAAEADGRGVLYRERPFVLGVDSAKVHNGWPGGETVLIQGIIDLWFLEGEEIVLVDYKTDRVHPKEEEILRKRYHVQLEYYAQALCRITGHPVKECLLYSFALGKSLPVGTGEKEAG